MPDVKNEGVAMSHGNGSETPQKQARKLQGIYLNDHLAGAAGGAELARRLAKANRMPGAAPTLRRLASEISQDHGALQNIMRSLHFPIRRYKALGAWTIEKVRRLKLNGRLVGRSALGDLIEIEALRLGVEGKAAAWRTLRTLADHDHRLDTSQLDALQTRAHHQLETLEDLRIQAADNIF
jgi:hypothetical protein